MLLEALILSFLVAWIRGGRLQDEFGIRHMWLAPVAFGVQVLNSLVIPPGFLQVVCTMVSYGLLLAFASYNMTNQGVRFLLIGMVLNLVVIGANWGRIPVNVEAAHSLGIDVQSLKEGSAPKHEELTSTSRLAFLGDVIPLRYPIPRMLSVGDIFATIGAFLIIQDLMGKPIVLLRSERAKD